jgi:hypothetical protein
MAQDPLLAEPLGPEGGEARIRAMPAAHHGHFPVGGFVVAGADATGLSNPAVWKALERRGLVRWEGSDPVLTAAGRAYEVGRERAAVLHSSDH